MAGGIPHGGAMSKDETSNLSFDELGVADKMTRLSNRSDAAELPMAGLLGGADCRDFPRESQKQTLTDPNNSVWFPRSVLNFIKLIFRRCANWL